MATGKVHILPAEVVGKIAAGEVIERPASVVKELVENSLDAGASAIEVELRSSGKTMIRINDNGDGIAREDIETLFSRHATSKIAVADDLFDIRSLGFRGEALYSIGAVADVTLSSRAGAQDCGWQNHLRGGERISLKPCTMRQGTQIEVRELFFNTPARRKFLKSNAAELTAVIDTLLPYALLMPAAGFSLTNDGKSYMDLKPAKNLTQRIAEALNLPGRDLIEDRMQAGDIILRLVLGDINIQRPRKDLQFVFVNGRPVESRSISFHVNEIYRLLFPPRTYPFFCVFVEMPARDLDVNVHPAKREVKIKDDLRLIGLLRPFCERLLMTRSKARQARTIFAPPQGTVYPTAQETYPAPGKDETPPPLAEPASRYERALEESLALFRTDAGGDARDDLKEKLRQARYLGNLLKKFLLFETGDSLLVIDQHAAQERIMFEKLKNQLEKGNVEIQPLLAPVTFSLSPGELVFWEENKEALAKTGFETTLCGKDALAVHAHPALIADPERAVRNLLAGEKLALLDHGQIARMACRSSVMFGFAMNPEQAEFQRRSLLLCDAPFTCPHGRPTVVEIKEEELRKHFLRQ